ncbi:MAG: hypothetical protein WD845_01725 [Pirellulales bacterium]
MSAIDSTNQQVEQDIWAWIQSFVTAKSEFYSFKFAPCPYARQAVASKTVDVQVWLSGDIREYIKRNAVQMRDCPTLTTRVMVFPPKTQFQWGINDFVEDLNMELIATNVFLNTGVAKTTKSRYPGSNANEPYFIVIANSLAAVIAGSEALEKTDYYKDWPAAHYAHVVERRARMAKKFGLE